MNVLETSGLKFESVFLFCSCRRVKGVHPVLKRVALGSQPRAVSTAVF